MAVLYDDATEYVQVPITTTSGVAPSAVEFAFLPLGLGPDDAEPSDWITGELTDGGAQILIGPDGHDIGADTYSVYVRVHASPETAIRRAGQLTIR